MRCPFACSTAHALTASLAFCIMYSKTISSLIGDVNPTCLVIGSNVIVKVTTFDAFPLFPLPSIDYGPYEKNVPCQTVAPTLKRCVLRNKSTCVLKSSSVCAMSGSRS
jgi:hypothetical protein